MKIAHINTVEYGSTGRIMLQLAALARENGHEAWTFSSEPRYGGKPIPGHTYYGSFRSYCVHYVLGRLTGGNGLFSHRTTRRLIRELKAVQPDIIHLHNLHGFCFNLPMLFAYLRQSGARVVWTLHDCWAFTGHCPHFVMANCSKWRDGCHHCPLYKAYPESCVDNAKRMWRWKKKWFASLPEARLVAPSQWLAGLAGQSFLGKYPVEVINNGVDLSVFKPTENQIRETYGIAPDKRILLGVAHVWDNAKGLDVFIELASRLDGRYQIVLVGTDEDVEKQLPANILSIRRTQNQTELAQLYTAADLFINPTRAETLGLVNIEANACGTPVITFATGGSPEVIDSTSGMTVPCGDVGALIQAIESAFDDTSFSAENCIRRAQLFDKQRKYGEYLALYERLAKP
ncbi:MAG: glycosyltransferase [Clostridia bacterium]|nr:glycosyltransferase [Clostridia bacterium]